MLGTERVLSNLEGIEAANWLNTIWTLLANGTSTRTYLTVGQCGITISEQLANLGRTFSATLISIACKN